MMCLLRSKQEKPTALPLDEHIKQMLKDVIRKNSRPKSHKLTNMRTSHSIQVSSLSQSRGYAKQNNSSGETSLKIVLLLLVIMIPLMGPKSIFIVPGPKNVQIMSAIVVSACCDCQKAKSEQQGCCKTANWLPLFLAFSSHASLLWLSHIHLCPVVC